MYERLIYDLDAAAEAAALEIACGLQEMQWGNWGLASQHLDNAEVYCARILNDRVCSRASVLIISARRLLLEA